MENLGTIKEKIRDHISELQKRFFVREIGVFGSFASQSQDDSSDIDILVSFKNGHNDFFNYSRCKDYLEELLEREIDLVPRNALRPEMREDVLREVSYA